MLLQFFHFIFYPAQSLRIADVVGLDIALDQQVVVNLQLSIEADGAHGRQIASVCRVILSIDVVCNKSAKIRHNHAVIAQEEYFYMSVKFNHNAKLLLFPDMGK